MLPGLHWCPLIACLLANTASVAGDKGGGGADKGDEGGGGGADKGDEGGGGGGGADKGDEGGGQTREMRGGRQGR